MTHREIIAAGYKLQRALATKSRRDPVSGFTAGQITRFLRRGQLENDTTPEVESAAQKCLRRHGYRQVTPGPKDREWLRH